MMRLTIADLAKLTGYAKSTVSAALNDRPGVNPETRAEILRAAREHEFIPNAFAKGLSMKNTATIGIVVRDISNPFYAKMCRAIEQTAGKVGFTTLIANTDGVREKEQEAIRLMISKVVSGVIVDISGNDSELLSELQRWGMPFVIFGAGNLGIQADCVEADDYTAAYQAVEYLIQMGHTRIGFVHGGTDSVYSNRRLNGIRAALEQHGLPLPMNYILHQAKTVEEGRAIGERLLSMSGRPSAVIAYNDLAAVGMIQAIEEAGEHVPDFLSVVGFDGIDLVTFPLTTVSIPMWEMGAEATELLLQNILGKRSGGPKKVVMSCQLREKKSVKRWDV